MTSLSYHHISVLLNESIDALQINPNGVYVDGTFGGGGHSKAILAKLGNKGRLFAFDHDEDAWKNVPKDEKRITLIKENFRYMKRFLKLHNIKGVNGILLDLGVSSFQFDTAERGFSIRFDANLDMRMDKRLELTAADIVNTYDEKKLQLIFQHYGEVRNAKTLASTIVEERKKAKIFTIDAFKSAIDACIKGNEHRYLAQVFQALRIEVNQELEVLKDFLNDAADCLLPGGRLCIITFHSLEDRLVKRYFKTGTTGEEEQEKDVFGRILKASPYRILKDVEPTEEEQRINSRSRSARLRIAEKII